MTAYLTRTIRQAGIVLALAVSFSALSATSSFAYSSEAQQMCTGDAFRLCSDEIPNISKITACMMKKRASLSTGCRAVMDRDLAQIQQGCRAVDPHSGHIRETLNSTFRVQPREPRHDDSSRPKRRCGAGLSALERALVHDRVGVTT